MDEPGAVIEIASAGDAREVLRSPHFSIRTGGAGDELFRGGTLSRLDGEPHSARRRIMGELLSRGGHRRFRDQHLFPAAEAAIAEALRHRDEDGVIRLEVRAWARRINLQLGAALAGYDAALTPEGADALFELMQTFIAGYQSKYENAFAAFNPAGPPQQAALRARDAIAEHFYRPALERRRALIAEAEAGSRAEADLPLDLMTMIAQRRDPSWIDDDVAQRDALLLLGAGLYASSNTLVWALRELFAYLDDRPDEAPRLSDDQFLLAAIRETLRLHPSNPGLLRRAEADVRLPSGVEIAAGSLIVVRTGAASVAGDQYGPDSLEFEPDRERLVASASPHGFAFGAGPHMCFGMPTLMGAEGIDGSLVYLLRSLLRAGARPDPATPAVSLRANRGRHDPAIKMMPLIVILGDPSSGAARDVT